MYIQVWKGERTRKVIIKEIKEEKKKGKKKERKKESKKKKKKEREEENMKLYKVESAGLQTGGVTKRT